MYNIGFLENIYLYVNNINIIEGGMYLVGFCCVLICILKKYVEDSKMLEKVKVEIFGDDFCEGLIVVIFVKVVEF